MWLLDSNTFSAFGHRDSPGHERVLARGDWVGWDNVGLPSIVIVEALRGRLLYLDQAYRREPRHIVAALTVFDETHRLTTTFPSIPFDGVALSFHVQKRLFPGTMSRHDRLIAAIALAGDHILVTRNVADFRHVPGLRIENCIDAPLP